MYLVGMMAAVEADVFHRWNYHINDDNEVCIRIANKGLASRSKRTKNAISQSTKHIYKRDSVMLHPQGRTDIQTVTCVCCIHITVVFV